MGGTGSMNIVLKNNRNLLKKRKSLKSIYKDGLYEGNKTACHFPEISPKALHKFRERLKAERKQRTILRLLVFGLVMSSVIVALMATV